MQTQFPDVARLALRSDSDDSDEEFDSSIIDTQRTHRRTHDAGETSTPSDVVICAISESRPSDVLGLATLNVTTGTAEISRILNDDKFCYQRLFEVLFRREDKPQLLLVLKTVIEKGSKPTLVQCLTKEYPDVPIVRFDRKHWSEANGLRMAQRFSLHGQTNAIEAALERNFYASCAFSAVMAYAQDQMKVHFTYNSLNIQYSHPVGTLRIDRSVVGSLELLENIRPKRSKTSTLFGILNTTQTPQGRRLLRSQLLQPSMNASEIVERYNAVEELASEEKLFLELRKGLKALHQIDIERVISWILREPSRPRQPLEAGVPLFSNKGPDLPSHEDLNAAEWEFNNILMLKEYLHGVEALHQTLSDAVYASRLLTFLEEQCAPHKAMEARDLLRTGIEEDSQYGKSPTDLRNNRLWAIKAKPGSILKKARESYKTALGYVHAYVDDVNKVLIEYLGNGGKLCFDSDRRYHIQLHVSDVESHQGDGRGFPLTWKHQLGSEGPFVTAVRKGNFYYCQTGELVRKSMRAQLYADVVTVESDKYIVELKTSLRQHAKPLLDISDAVGILDMICSFTELSATQNYVRPIISNTDNLVLKNARNPIVEVRRSGFTPNDMYSGSVQRRSLVITGGNMTGKSTFLKMVALCQILAQMGCFVPAEYAEVPICDAIFTRLSTDDKPESNLGTFAVEMRDMNLCLRQATKNSLVIVDELGRGTSPKDGMALALSMAVRLIDIGARLIFATHFCEVGIALNEMRFNSVLAVHFDGHSTKDADTRTPQIMLSHRLVAGPVPADKQDYGLDLVRRFFPAKTVRNAETVTNFLRQKKGQDNPKGGVAHPVTSSVTSRKRLCVALQELLNKVRGSAADDVALSMKLRQLQASFIKLAFEGANDADTDAKKKLGRVGTEAAERTRPTEA
ncbi:muts domain V-domain-containing protein, partial [Apodospora peruviana]